MNYNFCVGMNMGENDFQAFTMTWFYRALAISQKLDSSSVNFGQRQIDLGDRFMALWVCFNSIMRELYGENLSDNRLISACSIDTLWIRIFERDKVKLDRFLDQLMTYEITNMKTGAERKLQKKEFNELIWVIYDIRCNLFHGRKDPFDFENSKDYALIRLAFLILVKVVISYLKEKDLIRIHLIENYTEISESDIPKPELKIEDYLDGLIFEF